MLLKKWISASLQDLYRCCTRNCTHTRRVTPMQNRHEQWGQEAAQWPGIISVDPQGAVSHLGLIWLTVRCWWKGGPALPACSYPCIPGTSFELEAVVLEATERANRFFFFFFCKLLFCSVNKQIQITSRAIPLGTMQEISRSSGNLELDWIKDNQKTDYSIPTFYTTASGEPPLSPPINVTTQSKSCW